MGQTEGHQDPSRDKNSVPVSSKTEPQLLVVPQGSSPNPENYKKGHKYVIVTVTAWLATEWELEEDGSDEDRTPAGK
jgi:hypothetical protein